MCWWEPSTGRVHSAALLKLAEDLWLLASVEGRSPRIFVNSILICIIEMCLCRRACGPSIFVWLNMSTRWLLPDYPHYLTLLKFRVP